MSTKLLINRDEEKNIDYLVEFTVKQNNGKYFFHSNLIDDEHDGFIRWIPFREGDFKIAIAEGRKSEKKLEKYNNFIENNKEKLKELWDNKEYTNMAILVRDSI